ncbi:nuclear transport factor 2 family protein [Euzebyella marina]|uniref:Nuclear transport factor 2 family protein n=1 Tax=Euzebyella marina TaxID=1761453 RepID=A0A3G2L615_9FLAO|nr:nuclear transport factor 2 family protein [Euzebyella marina]AYN67653.1 nuclear transport factor 2 family protein [Euzebyella marina]
MNRKEIAAEFLKSAGMGRVDEAYEKYVSHKFVHHNQYFKGSRNALLEAMKEAHLTHPNKSIDIKYSYEDGDTVLTHSLVVKEDMDIAVVHIFRFESDKIVELWDLGQVIEKDSPNENGLF